MARPARHEIEVTLRPPGELGGRSIAVLDQAHQQLQLGDDDRLRAELKDVLDEGQRRLSEASGAPLDAFQPVFLAGSSGSQTELGWGFAVAADGRVRKSYDLAGEPFGDLLRAFEQDLLDGDPREIEVTFMPQPAYLGGAGWDEFVRAADALWIAWQTVGAAVGPAPIIIAMFRRFRGGAGVLTRHRTELEQQGFTPGDVLALCTRKRWKLGDLALTLDMTAEETTQLLEGLGFERDAEGTWRITEPNLDVSLRLFAVLTSYSAMVGDIEALQQEARSALEELAERSGGDPEGDV